MGSRDYEEFDLQLDRAGDGYTVRVVGSPTGPTAAVPFELPGTPESLKLLVLTLRAVRRIRALETEAAPDAREYGTRLFEALFHDDVLSALRGSLHVASTHDRGLRLRLRFSDPTVLANVPWELLYDPVRHRFLCQYGKYPVVRYLEVPEPVTPLRVEGPVRMLVVISAPKDYPDLDVEVEWQHLSTVLEPLVAAGRLRLDRLPVATLADIHRALLEDEYHVFHYIGHGGIDPRTGDGVLALTGPDGLSRLETGQDLGVMLSNSPIRLAVLNSCEGARINDVDPYAGTAISLVQQGIPAVVAMQFEISDEAAFAFSSTLYDAITDGRPIDLAVTLARQAILATSRTEWATPVLYLRSADGVIFDIPHPAPQSAAATPLATPAPPAPHTEPTLADESAPPSSPVPAEARATPPATAAVTPAPTPVEGAAERPAEEPLFAPIDLTAALVGRHDVDLRWGLPEGGTPARSWEVLRDGDVVLRTGEPGATDVVPGPGRYTYTVIALDHAHRRSPQSEPRSVFVDEPTLPLPGEHPRRDTVGGPGLVGAGAPAAGPARPSRPARQPQGDAVAQAGSAHAGTGPGAGQAPPKRRRWAWILAGLAVLLLAWLVIPQLLGDEEGGEAVPAQPVGVESVLEGQTVRLTWAQPEDGTPQVDEWVVFRDGSELGPTPIPEFTDEPGEGEHTYVVVAVGPGGVSPESEPRSITVPGGDDGPPPPPPPATPTADLAVAHESLEPGAGSGELDAVFRVEELLGEHPAEDVTVTVSAGVDGRLLDAVIAVETDSPVRCVEESRTDWVCRVPRIAAGAGTLLRATVLGTDVPYQLTVSVGSATEDPNPGNNSTSIDVETAGIL